VSGPGEPFRAAQTAVSAGFFEVLGTTPLLGRTFRAEDDVPTAPKRVILGHDLWRRRFSSDPGVVGRVLTVGEGKGAIAFEVIGVMPAGFRIPAGAEVWIALKPSLAEGAARLGWNVDGVRAMYAVARLADGATVDAAVAELSAIARREERAAGHHNTAMTVVATPLEQHLLGPARPVLLAIGGAACVLLLIACANAAGLLIVQTASRRREVAVRLALGAQRWQIVRQLLCESLLLSAVAAAIGVALAYAAFDSIVALAPVDVPRLEDAAVDGRALLFALVLCAATALAAGLLPAWQHAHRSLITGLQLRSASGVAGSSTARGRKVLVAAQLAAAVVLLTAAGLFTRSFVSLLRLDLGFDPANVLTFELDLPEESYGALDRHRALVAAVLERARELPRAVAAGAVYQRPFEHGPIGMDSGVIVEGQPLAPGSSERNPILNWEVATPGYFEAMGIAVLKGRLFDDRDSERAPPVVIVSQSLASRLWPGRDAIGRRLLTYGHPGNEKDPGWQTVVGVVEDARYREIQAPRFDIYLPYRQAPNPVQHFMVRASRDPLASVSALQSAVRTIDPRVSAVNVTTMDAIVGRAFAPWRFSTIVVSAIGIMALTFAAVGLAALVAFAVTQRTREIGVRLALGAGRRQVIGLLLGDAVWMAAGGLSAGLLMAWMLRRFVTALLFGVSASDGVTFLAVCVALVSTALLAAWLPARRAARIDPAVALRNE
jgi:predicted permease